MFEGLLEPKSVALIGASRTPGKVGHETLANLKDGGYKGAIVPINPSCTEVIGLKCYPDLATYGKPVDLAVIAIPTAGVRSAVESCIKARVKAICIITAGFKEVGHDGAVLEKDIAAMCRTAGIRLLGPNCLGLINTYQDMNASFSKRMPIRGGISFISQSGALLAAILDWAVQRRLGMAKLISMGNKADLSETDFITAFAQDPETKVIVGYLESIAAGNQFIQAAEAASLRKPIVIFKSGVTLAGVKAASSHTGSLAGADVAYDAAFARSGIIRAETFEALFDYATAFAMQPLPKGRRVAIITNAGGPGIMAADAIERSGMKVATLDAAIADALRKKLPAAASVGNPIDVLGDADPERYAMALRAAEDDASIDAIVVILTPQAMTKPAETAQAIAANRRGTKPVLACFMGGQDVMPGREALVASNIPDYTATERAVAALKAMCVYAEWLQRPARVITPYAADKQVVEQTIEKHVREERKQVGEAAAKQILRAYGFQIPAGQFAATAKEAVALADRVGYPIAMKIVSPDIIHKSDMGGVKLNLGTADAVREAFDGMMAGIRQRAPEARLDGVYVERMCSKGREVILGMTRDPQFGPMLMFGLGGIFVEVMKDVAFRIAPITEQEAARMIESTRSFALLKGIRGQAGVDLAAIANGLQRIGQLALDFPQIMEMDINPFIVGSVGSESVAADARITLANGK